MKKQSQTIILNDHGCNDNNLKSCNIKDSTNIMGTNPTNNIISDVDPGYDADIECCVDDYIYNIYKRKNANNANKLRSMNVLSYDSHCISTKNDCPNTVTILIYSRPHIYPSSYISVLPIFFDVFFILISMCFHYLTFLIYIRPDIYPFLSMLM